uniref:STEAP3 metalloreductase n=1 Tax=Scleropages formosus TaxID=113540 RepID=A0A8C9SSX6_SCLFO
MCQVFCVLVLSLVVCFPDVPACDLKSPAVGILGTGDFSRSLAHRLLACGLRVIVGSRSPDRNADRFPAGVEVSTQRDAAAQAHVLFVALFPDHYSSLAALKGELAGKVLVDVSNGTTLNRSRPSNAEELAALFPESSVVKGFNVLSAWALLNGPRDGSRQVLICSDDFQAKNRVALLARSMGFVPVDMGCLSSARDIENAPLYLFPSWGSPFLCAVCLFFSFYIYNFFRGVLLPYMVNETLPLVSLVMLALVYLPGLLAAGLQLLRGTKYQHFPCGSTVGYVCASSWPPQLLLCSMHALYSLCLLCASSARYKLLNAAFKQVRLGQESSWMEQDVWRMELYLSFGIVALGVLSFASDVVSSGLGYAALSISTLHTLTFGWNRAFDPGQYEFYLPPTFVLAVLLPCIVLLGRLALALHPESRTWSNPLRHHAPLLHKA